MAVIDVDLVPRWTQEPPATALGEAFMPINADDNLVEIPFDGDAAVVLEMDFPVVMPLAGDAQVAADTVIAILTVVTGDAEAAITSTAQSIDVNITAGIALAEITGSADFIPSLPAEIAFGILDFSTISPKVTGSASVSFVDNGQGSPPLFPFTFPTNFTDNPLGIQTADAAIVIECSSEDVAAGGFADALLVFADYGTVFPHTFPIQFEGLQGSTPIFPFVVPAVFTTQTNGRLASAELLFEMDVEAIPVLIGDASAAITSTAIRVDETRLPFAFPGQFPVRPSSFGYATLEFDCTAETAVLVTGSAEAAITSTADRIDPTRFPFVLPAQFIS